MAPPPPGGLLHCDVSATVGFTPHLCQGMHEALGRVIVTDKAISGKEFAFSEG